MCKGNCGERKTGNVDCSEITESISSISIIQTQDTDAQIYGNLLIDVGLFLSKINSIDYHTIFQLLKGHWITEKF